MYKNSLYFIVVNINNLIHRTNAHVTHFSEIISDASLLLQKRFMNQKESRNIPKNFLSPDGRMTMLWQSATIGCAPGEFFAAHGQMKS